MKNIKNTFLYLILITILAVFTFQACTKDEVEVQGNSNTTILSDSLVVDNRNGDTYPIGYINTASMSYHQKNEQDAFNIDSLAYRRYVRVAGYTKSLGTLDPNYSNKPARLYHVTYKYKDSTSVIYPQAWIKDTTATNFTIYGNVGTNLVKGQYKQYHTYKTPVFKSYYDTNYKKMKVKFEYDVIIDSIEYKDYIPATTNGAVHWLNHKM